MEELKTNELKIIDGGSVMGITELLLLATGVPFVVGVIDGFLSPIYVNS
jgi:hypothetical protein